MNLIKVLGKRRYHEYKQAQGVAQAVTIQELTKRQAWLLINAITSDIEAQNERKAARTDDNPPRPAAG